MSAHLNAFWTRDPQTPQISKNIFWNSSCGNESRFHTKWRGRSSNYIDFSAMDFARKTLDFRDFLKFRILAIFLPPAAKSVVSRPLKMRTSSPPKTRFLTVNGKNHKICRIWTAKMPIAVKNWTWRVAPTVHMLLFENLKTKVFMERRAHLNN